VANSSVVQDQERIAVRVQRRASIEPAVRRRRCDALAEHARELGRDIDGRHARGGQVEQQLSEVNADDSLHATGP
jgi:hypothetical protein